MQPFQFSSGLVEVPSGTQSQSVFFSVPAGKLLIIEFIAGFATLPLGQFMQGSISTSVISTLADYAITAVKAGTHAEVADIFVFTHQVHLYADPETQVAISIARLGPQSTAAPGAYSYRLSVSGQLVDKP